MTGSNSGHLNRYYPTTAWGLLLILWGITILFDFIHIGIGLVGTGLILLGLNAARSLKGIATRGSTTVVGILALVWGGLELARLTLPLPSLLSDWAIFAILLIVLGLIVLARELLRVRQAGLEGQH